MKRQADTPPANALAQAVGEYRAALKRQRVGRVVATSYLFDGVAVHHKAEVDNLTDQDLDQLIRCNRPVLSAKAGQ